jgi:hypothetical protein
MGFLCEVSWLVEHIGRCALENLQNVRAGLQQRFHSLQSVVNADWTHAEA